jgi:hypothetical protein
MNNNKTKLSSNVNVSKYLDFVENKDKASIISFIKNRFTERYILPFRDNKSKHGFSMMAVSCLMIETLESFWNGWLNSKNKSEKAFCYFFDRSNRLIDFRGYSKEFYKHVRCGILHQAETTGGWRITRKGELFNKLTKTINATEFIKILEEELSDYCNKLNNSHWDSEIWRNLRKKMNKICKNTELK